MMKNERTYKNDIVSKGIHKRNNVAIFSSIKYFKNHNIFKLKFKIMLIKERINTLCSKYLNVQPLFRTPSRNVVVSPVRESSLRNIYGNGLSQNRYDCDWSNYNNNTSGAYNNNNVTNSSSSMDGNNTTSNNIGVEQESEDSLMQLVYNYPEKTLWFLNGTLNVCIISFSVMGAFSTLYVLYNWNYNYERSPYLTVWLLIHGLLQIVQVVFRVIYKFILNKESIQNSCGGRIIFILQSVKRLTKSKTWRIGRLFSILYYIWFSAGFYWILSVRPSSGEYEYDDSSGLNRLNRSDLVENSYVLSQASHYLLKSNSFDLVNNLIKVDFNSNLWPFYLITMLVCTLRIIGMLFFFYFVFPSMVSSDYSENKFKAYTINKLENLPVKAYSEWKNIKEKDRCNGKKHLVLQDNCIICLNDFSNQDLTRCLPCDHVFHEDCIDLWLLRNAVCPLCQTALK